NGHQLAETSESITIPALTSLAITPLALNTIKNFVPSSDVAVLEFAPQGERPVQHTLFFAKTRELKLPQLQINFNVTLSPDGKGFLIHLASKTLARAVQISLPGFDATFSDNFFDLLPNESVDLHLETPASLSEARAALHLTSVADATS